MFATGFESADRTTPSSAHRLVYWSLRLVGCATCLASDYEPHCDRSFNAILETSAKVYRELMSTPCLTSLRAFDLFRLPKHLASRRTGTFVNADVHRQSNNIHLSIASLVMSHTHDSVERDWASPERGTVCSDARFRACVQCLVVSLTLPFTLHYPPRSSACLTTVRPRRKRSLSRLCSRSRQCPKQLSSSSLSLLFIHYIFIHR